jgi:glyoxylase-like metal-dependent hydrolase (beta-lactamase superfamily II)
MLIPGHFKPCEMKLQLIETGNFMLDGGAAFGVVPKALWQKQYPADENNLCKFKLRSLLVETEDRKILVDTGIGAKQDDKFLSHYHLHGNETLVESLLKANVKPEEITDVFLTHLHFDHCGGCVHYNDAGNEVMTFPYATHWVSRSQWENYHDSNPREGSVYFKENMRAVESAGALRLVEDDFDMVPGFSVRLFNGHTPGLMIPFISTQKGVFVFTSDLIPVMASIPTAWVAAYDTMPVVSMREKDAFLAEAAGKGHVLVFQHDFYTECCTVTHSPKGIKPLNIFILNDILRQ